MALIDALRKEWAKFNERGWERFYIAVDLHDTILKSNYNGIANCFLPKAKEALQMLSVQPEVTLILFTSSHKTDIEKYLNLMIQNDIYFDYVNENPCEDNNALSCFDDKFYFNILIDDKAGFVESDWKVILDFFSDSNNFCLGGNFIKKQIK
jgi:hypothetical protein